ncbi:prepilin-type N-terminal cleavage/methylation domain-containing protein [Dongshaea marina]|uniref:prepilin-type N-terminal cleavage/methylation domain-containing protein n=1 Tax=Dongshaea marina TaxID=2047966 RepID=UPI000D3E8422|nr:prepilin-type N-terminal cleavage/methylation domain-containing protein [Dongshaea marina]
MIRLIRNSGFGLIEVLLALVVVSVGASALVKLSKIYIQTTGESRDFEVALQLAESKMDDLTSYEVIQTTTGKFAYQDLANNTGGEMTSGSYSIGSVTYLLTWAVTNQYWIVGSWMTTEPSPLPAYPERKQLVVNVAWIDREGVSQSISLDSTVSPNISSTSSELNSLLIRSEFPRVSYIPELIPDVMGVVINSIGIKRETQKPSPIVYKEGRGVLVKFETISFDTKQLRTHLQEQVTLSCDCSIQSAGSALLPATSYYHMDAVIWRVGETASKGRGVPDSHQPSLCSKCCLNHFDGVGNSFDNYYHQARKSHMHFHYSDRSYSPANSIGDNYEEACRFQRIGGYYQPMPDWNLIALVAVGPDFLLNTENRELYESYISYAVKAYAKAQIQAQATPSVLETFVPTPFAEWLKARGGTTEITVAPGTYQLIARGIYADFMEDSYLNELDLVNDADVLQKLPFYELNLTLLGDWSSSDTNYAVVTSESIQTLTDTESYYFGSFSRGRLHAIADTNSLTSDILAVTVKVKRSNSGITGTQAISLADTASLSATLKVKIENSKVD